MTGDRVARAYSELVGEEALERQQRAAQDTWVCCGEWKGGPHHRACAKFVPEEQPAVIDGQESLL